MADHEHDAEVFSEALAAFRSTLEVTDPGASWVPTLLARYEKRLAELCRQPGGR